MVWSDRLTIDWLIRKRCTPYRERSRGEGGRGVDDDNDLNKVVVMRELGSTRGGGCYYLSCSRPCWEGWGGVLCAEMFRAMRPEEAQFACEDTVRSVPELQVA